MAVVTFRQRHYLRLGQGSRFTGIYLLVASLFFCQHLLSVFACSVRISNFDPSLAEISFGSVSLVQPCIHSQSARSRRSTSILCFSKFLSFPILWASPTFVPNLHVLAKLFHGSKWTSFRSFGFKSSSSKHFCHWPNAQRASWYVGKSAT